MISLKDGLNLLDSNRIDFGSEVLPLNLVINRILDEDIYSNIDIPLYDNSSMDGYGVKLNNRDDKVKVIGRVLAGSSENFTIVNGKSIKIMTGARVDKSIEAIVPFEDTTLLNDFVQLPKKIKKNQNIRRQGSEYSSGELVAKSGELIKPSLIGLLATFGITYVKVKCLPKIGIISSGDELVEPWQSRSGEVSICNSNSFTILSILNCHGYSADYIGIINDTNSVELLKDYMSRYDILITSGGVSKGESDYIQDILTKIGTKTLFHGVDIKPGKPIAVNRYNNTMIFSLPGNPMSVYTTASIFLLSYIGIKHKKITTISSVDFNIYGDRTNVVYGFYDCDKNHFTPYNNNIYSSNMLRSVHSSNSFCILNKSIKSGDKLEVFYD